MVLAQQKSVAQLLRINKDCYFCKLSADISKYIKCDKERVFFKILSLKEYRFRTVQDKMYTLMLYPKNTIGDVKSHLMSMPEFEDVNTVNIILRSQILADHVTMDSLKLRDNSSFIIHIRKTPNLVIPRTPNIRSVPLDTTTPKPKYDYNATGYSDDFFDPEETLSPDYPLPQIPEKYKVQDDLLTTLVDMGFSLEDARYALKVTRNDLNSSVSFILANPGIGSVQQTSVSSKDDTPKYGDLQSFYDSMTQEQKNVLERIQRRGLSPFMAISIYRICDGVEDTINKVLSPSLETNS